MNEWDALVNESNEVIQERAKEKTMKVLIEAATDPMRVAFSVLPSNAEGITVDGFDVIHYVVHFELWKTILFRGKTEVLKETEIVLRATNNAFPLMVSLLSPDLHKAKKVILEPKYSWAEVPDWLREMAAVMGWEVRTAEKDEE